MTAMSKCASVAHHFNGHAEVFEAIHAVSPNAACPGLLRKPLDAAIRRLLAPYCPGGRQGDSKHNNDVNVSTLLAVLMIMAVCRYYTAVLPDGGCSWLSYKTTTCHHRVSTHSDSINRTCLPLILQEYLIVNLLKTDEKQLYNMAEYFLGVVKLALYHVFYDVSDVSQYSVRYEYLLGARPAKARR